MMNSVGNNLGTNNLEKFYAYIQENYGELEEYITAVQCTYDLGLEFYLNSENVKLPQMVAVEPDPTSRALMTMITKYALFFFEDKTGVKATSAQTGGYILHRPTNLPENEYFNGDEKLEQRKDAYPFIYDNNYENLYSIAERLEDPANNGTIITYYGEYKLPNSTIAVAVDANGNYDINKPLKNGYIGVIFDITAKAGTYGKSSTPISLSYGAATKTYSEISANRKTEDLLKTIDAANTSQWDYEGYLGFKNFGYTATFTAATSIRLEDGQWSLSNDLYKKVKGTVILYDADDRAATDYE
jgi:hypothetical protein